MRPSAVVSNCSSQGLSVFVGQVATLESGASLHAGRRSMIAGKVLAHATLAALIAGLSACGGGGPGGETQTVTLVVAFSYPDSQSDVRTSVQLQPSITGLQGHSPVCTLTGGTLPPGVSLDSATCLLSGTPTTTGRYQATVT